VILLNIFYLHHNPKVAVKYMTNKHIVKMVLETAQILSTNFQYNWKKYRDPLLYKSTHPNHPSVVWARQSKANYKWTYDLFEALANEYTERYKRIHKSWFQLSDKLKKVPHYIPEGPFTEPPAVMPEEYICESSIESYKKYYINEKLKTKDDIERFNEWDKLVEKYWR
jgi:hypothetical protein